MITDERLNMLAHYVVPNSPAEVSSMATELLSLRSQKAKTAGMIRMALDELGVPSGDYPSPIINAVEILDDILKDLD